MRAFTEKDTIDAWRAEQHARSYETVYVREDDNGITYVTLKPAKPEARRALPWR